VVAVVSVALAILPAPGFGAALALGMATYLTVSPGVMARAELRPGRLAARRQPVCPECGYSLRRLLSRRCPECGSEFPTFCRGLLRWAQRRLAWDRTARGSLLFAYAKTTLMLAVWPSSAARGLAIPDHGTRALRWAAAHLAVLALCGTVIGSDRYYWAWARGTLSDPVAASFRMTPPLPQPAGLVAIWAAQSLAAWCITAVAPPLLGVLLGIAIPGRHPLARRSIAKWSLYLSLIPLLVLGVCYLTQFYALMRAAGYSWTAMMGPLPWPPPWQPRVPPTILLAVPYGLWWAIGVSVNPYLRARGPRVFASHAALYLGAWAVLTNLLFPTGALRSLL
jgi:hypothetical protein